MHKTKNDITANKRAKVCDILNARLADVVDLKMQAKQAHWNVKGPNFIGLHELFDTVAGHAGGWEDTIAERITALGGTAEGTVAVAAKKSSLKAYPLDIVSGAEHVDALSSAIAAFGKVTRAAIDQSTELGDAVTADLFTEVAGEVDKDLWLIEAHAQADR
ncbi:MAG: DNA starvation/stationary phase protection protein Dps [Alphaproteobacteria bacterium]|nr:DNA starvation/stationary phase protection protein Dps [Alphaproteobacteria bacterium]